METSMTRATQEIIRGPTCVQPPIIDTVLSPPIHVRASAKAVNRLDG